MFCVCLVYVLCGFYMLCLCCVYGLESGCTCFVVIIARPLRRRRRGRGPSRGRQKFLRSSSEAPQKLLRSSSKAPQKLGIQKVFRSSSDIPKIFTCFKTVGFGTRTVGVSTEVVGIGSEWLKLVPLAGS